MRKVVKRTKMGIIIKYISTPKEREESRKRLYKAMDKIYENYVRTKAKH